MDDLLSGLDEIRCDSREGVGTATAVMREGADMTRFLDDVVTANAYVPAVPQLRKAANRARRIGLGIMGLGDLMYHTGIRYGSEEAQDFSAQVMEFVRYHCMLTSVELAKDSGTSPSGKIKPEPGS